MDRRQAVELLVAVTLVVAAVPLALGAKNAVRVRSSPCNVVQAVSIGEPERGEPPPLDSEAKADVGARHAIPAPGSPGCGGNHWTAPFRSTIELGPFTLHHRLREYGNLSFGDAVTTIGAAPECAEGRLPMPRESGWGTEPSNLVLRRSGDGYFVRWNDYSTWRSMIVRIVTLTRGPEVSLYAHIGAPLLCVLAGLIGFVTGRRLPVGARMKRRIVVAALLAMAFGDAWLLRRRDDELTRIENDEV